MTPESLLQGNRLFSKIQSIKEQTEVLQNALENPTSIIFGTMYHPSLRAVALSEYIYIKMVKDQIEENNKLIEKYEKELLDL